VDAGFLLLCLLAALAVASLTTGPPHFVAKGVQKLTIVALVLLVCRGLYQAWGAWLRGVGSGLVRWIDVGGFGAVSAGALGSTGFFASARGAIETAPFQPLWLLGWLIGVIQLLSRERREAAMRQIGMVGWAAPFLYSLAFTTCSVAFFSYATMVERLDFDDVGDAYQLQAGRIATFYLWHFLALLPGVDVPETLRWQAPLEYSSPILGAHVLTFQLTVALTVISLVKSYLASRPLTTAAGDVPASDSSPEPWSQDPAPGALRSGSGSHVPGRRRRTGSPHDHLKTIVGRGERAHRSGGVRIAGRHGRG
jgi:hypothetical protein